MNLFTRNRDATRGMTLVELLVTLAIIAILASLLLPTIGKGKARAIQIKCVSQLKQVGVGFHVFAHDHNNLFPVRVSTNNGGTMEYVQTTYAAGGDTYFSYRHLQVLAETLKDPRLVRCPADSREPARSFETLRNDNVSYFVASTAAYNNPSSILSGDRNITNQLGFTATLMGTGFTTPVGWTHELHQFRGNLLYADGRVEQTGRGGLADAWSKVAASPNLLMLPSTPPPAGAGEPPSGRESRPRPGSPDAGSNGSPPMDEATAPVGERDARAPQAFPATGSDTAGAGGTVATTRPPSSSPETTEERLDVQTPLPAAPKEAEKVTTVYSEAVIQLIRDGMERARNWTYLWLLLLLVLALSVRFWLWQRSLKRRNHHRRVALRDDSQGWPE